VAKAEHILSPAEKVQGRWKVKGYEVIVTDKRLAIREGGKIIDVALQHVVSIELEERWGWVIFGLVLTVVGGYLFKSAPGLAGFLVLIGIVVATWGYMNRFTLVVSYGMRQVKLKNGKKLVEIARLLREYVVSVKQT